MAVTTIKVRATKTGFYGELRKAGDEFDVKEEHSKASWYAPVSVLGRLNASQRLSELKPDNTEKESGLDENDELDLGAAGSGAVSGNLEEDSVI